MLRIFLQINLEPTLRSLPRLAKYINPKMGITFRKEFTPRDLVLAKCWITTKMAEAYNKARVQRESNSTKSNAEKPQEVKKKPKEFINIKTVNLNLLKLFFFI